MSTERLKDDSPTTAPEPRAPPHTPRTFPSDRLPLQVLGGIVLCFLVYFGAAWSRVDARATLAARAAIGDARDSAGTGDTYDVEVCNNTTEARLFVAFAYFDRAKSAWVSRGWFPQERGQCRLVMKNLSPPVYVYAESRDGRQKWAGADDDLHFCVDAEAGFVLDQKACRGRLRGERPTLRVQRFKRLDLPPRPDGVHRWELSD